MTATLTAEEAAAARHPGARRPDRQRFVSSHGLGLAVCEWGDPDAPAILLAHGGFALAELSNDVRPPDYATAFLRQAIELSGLERPLSVCCAERPEWLAAVAGEPGALETHVDESLRHYAAVS